MIRFEPYYRDAFPNGTLIYMAGVGYYASQPMPWDSNAALWIYEIYDVGKSPECSFILRIEWIANVRHWWRITMPVPALTTQWLNTREQMQALIVQATSEELRACMQSTGFEVKWF